MTEDDAVSFTEMDAAECNRKAKEDAIINRMVVLNKGETPRTLNTRIIQAAELKYNLDPGAIRSGSRFAAVVKARREAIVAVRQANPHWSYPQLGKLFRLDHSTIIYHLQVAGAWKEAEHGPHWSRRKSRVNINTNAGE